MNYQLRGLEPALFEGFFGLDDEALAARGMRWMQSDAPVGEPVLLLPFPHQDGHSPYRASGPIFVRRGRNQAAHIVNELPSYLTLRPLSVRAYDAADEMVDADIVDGAVAAPLIERLLARADVSYLHLHFARRGCFACRVDRF